MMEALVATALGCVAVELETGEAELVETSLPSPPVLDVSLPLVVAAAQLGSRVVAVVDRRPPLMVSDDTGLTWREALVKAREAPRKPGLRKSRRFQSSPRWFSTGVPERARRCSDATRNRDFAR